MRKLSGRRIIVTGASGGLGGAVAERFHAEGASLLLTGRRHDELQSLKNRLGAEVETIALDIADPIACERLFKGPWAEPEVLLNVAAVQGPIGPSWEADWTAWQSCLQIDLVATIALCHGSIPGMIRRGGGKIINLSGGGATGPRPGFAAYATAKAGLVRFSECIAQELIDKKIDVNCIAPGAMPTAMLHSVIQLGREVVGEREYQAAMRAQEVGHAVIANAAALCVYLASAESDGITGKLISASWDPWSDLQTHIDDLRGSDIYTLRRVVPRDRGKVWGG